MTTTALRPIAAPAHFAVAGFAVAGVILVLLDLRSPAAALTETISSHALTAARAAFVLALLASCAGVGTAVVRAWRATVAPPLAALPTVDLLLLTVWPVGIGLASLFDQNEHAWTGVVHNVAVGAAIVGVHLAAARAGSRLLTGVAIGGFAAMGVLLTMIVLHTLGAPGMPVGVVERVLVVVSAVLAIGALRTRRGTDPSAGVLAIP